MGEPRAVRRVVRRALVVVAWWTRWTVRYLPVLAYRRLTVCRRRGHGGWLHDGMFCGTCCAPWFGYRDRPASPSPDGEAAGGP